MKTFYYQIVFVFHGNRNDLTKALPLVGKITYDIHGKPLAPDGDTKPDVLKSKLLILLI